jgi:hypothetical protein
MTPDLQLEFQALSARAKQKLKEVPEEGSYRHVFSFWTMPSFSPSSRCTIYSPRPLAKGRRPFVSYTIWRSDLDLKKLKSPVERLKYPKDLPPTIQEDVIWLKDGEVEEIERRIRGISIPFYLGQCTVAGCDGTSFEFLYDELFFGCSLHWWENHPSEWRPFTEVVVRIATELEQRRKEKVESSVLPSDDAVTPDSNKRQSPSPS